MGVEFGVAGLGLWVLGLGLGGSGFRAWSFGFRAWAFGFRAWVLGFRAWASDRQHSAYRESFSICKLCTTGHCEEFYKGSMAVL